jgi:hypothetical protein
VASMTVRPPEVRTCRRRPVAQSGHLEYRSRPWFCASVDDVSELLLAEVMCVRSDKLTLRGRSSGVVTSRDTMVSIVVAVVKGERLEKLSSIYAERLR